MVEALAYLAIGAATGFFAGLLGIGIGGGAAAVGVPFLTWCGMTIHRAIGTVAALGFPVAISV